MGVHRTCGEPNEIRENTHVNNITALVITTLPLCSMIRYSAMADLGGNTVGVMWETDATSLQGAAGCVGASCAIVFAATNLPPL